MSKLKAWKEGMENKGLRVNMKKKTKLMVAGPDLDVLRDSVAFPVQWADLICKGSRRFRPPRVSHIYGSNRCVDNKATQGGCLPR